MSHVSMVSRTDTTPLVLRGRCLAPAGRVAWLAGVILIVASCATAPRTENVAVGPQQFVYDIPPLVDVETVGTVAVLMPTTPEAATFQALLQQEINRRLPDARVIDSRRLDEIVRERQLQGDGAALQRVGELLDVDLFVAADPYVDTESVVRFIARDGRVLGAVLTPNPNPRNLETVASQVATQLGGRVERSELDLWFAVSGIDPDPDRVRRDFVEGRTAELEDRFRADIATAERDTDRLNAYLNLYRLYHATQRFPEARSALDGAERALDQTGILFQAIRGDEIAHSTAEARARLDVDEEWFRLAKRPMETAGAPTAARTRVVVLPFEEGGSITRLGTAFELHLTLRLLESERVHVYERRHLAQLLDHQRIRAEDPALEGADIILTGLIIENSSITRQPEVAERTVEEQTQTGQVVERTERYIARTRVQYRLNVQGRLTETAGGGLAAETFRREADEWYPEEGPRDELVRRGTFEAVADALVRWVNTNF